MLVAMNYTERIVKLFIEIFNRIFIDSSYIESARQLEQETNLDISKYDVCDNIDLDTILQEYEYVFWKQEEEKNKNEHMHV